MTVIDLLELHLQKIRATGKGDIHLSPDVTEMIIDDLKKFELLKKNLETNNAKPAVLCKDCKYNISTIHNPICSLDPYRSGGSYWFCADGEKR